MPHFPSFSISIRRNYLLSGTIIGFARVVIDKDILLKEIPIFQRGESLGVIVSSEPVAICPIEMDMDTLNRVMYSCRELIEKSILDEVRSLNGKGKISN